HGQKRQLLALRCIRANPAPRCCNVESSVGSGRRFFVHIKPAKTWREEAHHGPGHRFRGHIDDAASDCEAAVFLGIRGRSHQPQRKQTPTLLADHGRTSTTWLARTSGPSGAGSNSPITSSFPRAFFGTRTETPQNVPQANPLDCVSTNWFLASLSCTVQCLWLP